MQIIYFILSRILMKTCEIGEKLKENKGGIPAKLLVFPLLIVIKLANLVPHKYIDTALLLNGWICN